MNWIEKAQLDYPTLFTNCYCGFDCEEGWKDLLLEVFEKLKEYPYLEIHQIKEKFGTLRLYVGAVEPKDCDIVYKIIDDAEAKSAIICELCGAPGLLRGGGWLMTRCDACEEKRKIENQRLREEYKREFDASKNAE